MYLSVTNKFKVNDVESVEINHQEPDECSVCNIGIQPVFLYGYFELEKSKAFVMYYCKKCNNGFIKCFEAKKEKYGNYKEINEENSYLAPTTLKLTVFSQYIKDISEQFIKIYNQAEKAECHSLSDVAGAGYRKALEFLVKDYIIKDIKDEEEKNNILKKPLSQCIKDNMYSNELKIVIERAAWIGNDETHYTRKHEDKDITDLKRLIKLAVNWIEIIIMTKETEQMPKK